MRRERVVGGGGMEIKCRKQDDKRLDKVYKEVELHRILLCTPQTPAVGPATKELAIIVRH